MEPCTPKRCCKDECGKDAKVSSLGYVVEVRCDAARVVLEDNSLTWCYFFDKEDEQQIVDGDFVRVYKRKHGETHRLYARYASYFFSRKDIATALVILDLGWQVQKCQLPEVENAKDLCLRPPCLEAKKQLYP